MSFAGAVDRVTWPGSRIGLGTVQFGLDYGVTNRTGRPSSAEVAVIGATARAAGMDTLDTAHLYGDSEAVIGRTATLAGFRVVTKTPKFADAASAGSAADILRAGLATSLERLGRSSVDVLLLHDATDLLGPHGATLWDAMEQAKAAGMIGKIGVSVYNGGQIDAVLAAYPVELVQLPINPLDRRLDRGGQLDRLAAAGVEIHARSLFLQGLLLQHPDRIAPRFGVLRDAVAELRDWGIMRGLSQLEAVLAISLADPRIDRFILGVTSVDELRDIVSALESGQGTKLKIDFAGCTVLDPVHLDPSRWSELGPASSGA